MAESCPKGQKTLWEKENLYKMSNFSFCHHVFKTYTADKSQPGLVWERVKNTVTVERMLLTICLFVTVLTLSQTSKFRRFQTQRACRQQF